MFGTNINLSTQLLFVPHLTQFSCFSEHHSSDPPILSLSFSLSPIEKVKCKARSQHELANIVSTIFSHSRNHECVRWKEYLHNNYACSRRKEGGREPEINMRRRPVPGHHGFGHYYSWSREREGKKDSEKEKILRKKRF